MRTHRFDPVSLFFGIVVVAVGIAAISDRLDNLINDRPDALIPLLVLGAGLLAIVVAARRGLHERGLSGFQDVDGTGDDQHHGAE